MRQFLRDYWHTMLVLFGFRPLPPPRTAFERKSRRMMYRLHIIR